METRCVVRRAILTREMRSIKREGRDCCGIDNNQLNF